MCPLRSYGVLDDCAQSLRLSLLSHISRRAIDKIMMTYNIYLGCTPCLAGRAGRCESHQFFSLLKPHPLFSTTVNYSHMPGGDARQESGISTSDTGTRADRRSRAGMPGCQSATGVWVVSVWTSFPSLGHSPVLRLKVDVGHFRTCCICFVVLKDFVW